MKISVIMASWLGAPNRENLDKKFIRAVNSFLAQTHPDKELIIVSDGCQKTKELYDTHFQNNPLIKFFMSAKQPMYSGGIRNIGLKIATGDIISYLDSDDVIGKDHLKIINEEFDTTKWDWVYYNDFLTLNKEFTKFEKRIVRPAWASIGTSSISHINFEKSEKFPVKPEWPTGYGHDYLFAYVLTSINTKFTKLEKNSQYMACHYRNGDF